MSRYSLFVGCLLCMVAIAGQAIGQSRSIRRGSLPSTSLAEVLAADATLHDVVFADAQHGWAVGDRGVVLATDDGGAHWRSQQSGVECPLLSVSFVDSQRGWIVGGTATPITHRTEGVVLRTVDGGQHWQRLNLPTLPRLTHVQFFDAAHGVAAGYGSNFYPSGLFTSSDGGKSWQPLGAAEQSTWLAADFANPTSGLLAGADARRAVVIDRELRPVPMAATDTRRPRAMAMTSPTSGWMVGDDGLVLRTTDAGATWQPPAALPPFGGAGLGRSWNINAVAARGNRVWLAGGPGSVVARSDDGGQTWATAATGVRAPITSLEFVDTEHGWAVGQLGTVLATTDGGRTWRSQLGGGRAAMLVATASPEHIPLEIIGRYSAGAGYRTVVLPLFERNEGSTESVDRHRVDQALSSIAAGMLPPLWSSASPPLAFHASPELLLTELNRQTDGLAREQLLGDLVAAIRTWRPEVLLVPHQRDQHRHAASAVVEQLAREATRAAADPTQHAELAAAGLEAWQVKRVVGLLPESERGSIRLPTDDFVPTLGGSPAGWTSTARGLLFTQHTLAPPLDELELIEQQGGLAVSTRDLFAGLNLPPGCDARRAVASSNPADLDRLRRLTQKRRQLVRLLDYAEGSPAWSAQVVNLTGGLDSRSGGDLMFQLADGYRETGRHAMAADTLYLLARRYPDHPLAEQALTWLVQYYASGEVAHVARRHQAQQARMRPLANVEYDSAGVKQAAAELPSESGGGTDSLTPDERFERATMLGGYLEKARPAMHAEPSLRFPLSTASRKQGFTNTADRYFAVLGKANVDSAWSAAAHAENWLAKPDELPPDKPVATCKATSDPPHLDGQFDEPFWQAAEPIRVADDRGRDDQTATTVKLARDEQYLYVAIDCPRLPDEEYPTSDQPRTRDADLAMYDRMHLAIDIDRDYSTAYQLTVDCRGWTHDACWGDTNWNPRWFVAHHLDERAWTAEVAIPWAKLSDPAPAVLDAWCLGIQRHTSRGHATSWTEATGDSPDAFGLMLFR